MKQAIALTLMVMTILLGTIAFDLVNNQIDLKPEDYAHISLSTDEQFQAIDDARREKFLSETGYYHSFFPLQKHIRIGTDTYVWFILEKIGFLALISIILWMCMLIRHYNVNLGKLLVIPTVGYFFLMVGDMIDFLLDYNNLEYGKVFGLPVTYNTVSFLTYVIFVFYQLVKHGGSSLRSNNVSGYGMANGSY